MKDCSDQFYNQSDFGSGTLRCPNPYTNYAVKCPGVNMSLIIATYEESTSTETGMPQPMYMLTPSSSIGGILGTESRIKGNGESLMRTEAVSKTSSAVRMFNDLEGS
jgi:hypothetical protein